jgi:hypothetical protein
MFLVGCKGILIVQSGVSKVRFEVNMCGVNTEVAVIEKGARSDMRYAIWYMPNNKELLDGLVVGSGILQSLQV